MHTLLYLLLIHFFFGINRVVASISINRIVVRTPKLNDIGLIFDVSIVNTAVNQKKEILEYRIRPDGTCWLNLTNNHMMKDASKVVGGNFGEIAPGATQTVSLIWPTVSLYNRVGFCPIQIVTTNELSEQCKLKHMIYFDTRFTTIDPEGRTFRKLKNYNDCNNWDKDYLRNCTPVDCEERYFGRRSFYNYTTEQCEEVPHCCKRNQLYDPWANECIDTENFCTEDDIEMIRQGKFEKNFLDFRPSTSPSNTVCNEDDGFKVDSTSTKDETVNSVHRRQTSSNSFANTNSSEDGEGLWPYWLKGLADGLLIVVATIAIYIMICFIIFLIVTCITRRSTKQNCDIKYNTLRSPVSSEHTVAPRYTASSLLSHER